MRDLAPNSYLMPGFDPAEISDLLEQQFQGEGGSIEQTGLYINPSSGARWSAVANQADYVAAQVGAKYEEIAKHIQHYSLQGIDTLDIFALGSGDGKSETQLTQHLIPLVNEVNLLLLDVSQPLLKRAHAHAISVLGQKHRDHILPVFGNMHHLSQASYRGLYNPQPKESRRLITMMGYTFGSLDAELLFVRNSLGGFAKGDLLLLDLILTYAPADQTEQIMVREPRLAGLNPHGWDAAYEEFLSNTIYQYCRGAKKITFTQELDYGTCSVPGSYTVLLKARVEMYEGKDRIFSMLQYKRYDMNKLADTMEREGWKSSTGWRYGQNHLMYLFEKDR